MPRDGLANIRRDYDTSEVERLAGSFRIRHTLAEMGAMRLRHLLETEPFVPTLGALTGNQAVQQVKAGLKAIYLSGWQVAADANSAGQMYPDQSLYPVDSVPKIVRGINNALRRADQIARLEDKGDDTYWMAPIIAAIGGKEVISENPLAPNGPSPRDGSDTVVEVISGTSAVVGMR